MAINVQNLRLGGCAVLWNGIDLGATIGGVQMSVVTTLRHSEIDHGSFVEITDKIASRKVSVKASFAEAVYAKMSVFLVAMNCTVQSDGSIALPFGAGFDMPVGGLRLHPVYNVGTYTNAEDWYIPFAKLTGNLQLNWDPDKETTVQLEWTCSYDGAGNILYYGDATSRTYNVVLNPIVDRSGSGLVDRNGNVILN